ncbi:hypothetical protein K3725_00100 [Leisingera sp. S132]|uniref:hypothetical protein n=1 Tax=Leisingera sp. S132 TaxID=2867016 RepID=UPI0021A283C2|nr:hypothetical protein [Leisingera sp. S132]UWQ79454.1 hypothetical protein K3725_00100 [Leisingera sp. S132]
MYFKVVRLYANLIAALFGRSKQQRREIRAGIYEATFGQLLKQFGVHANAPSVSLQNQYFPKSVLGSKRLMVIVVPEGNFMSGGIFSMFSIANQMRRLKREHGYDVIMMTRPMKNGSTYFRNSHFRNSEHVFRFEQLTYCDHVREIYIHLPEYLAETFYDDLSDNERNWLANRETVQINLLNQNIQLMPEAEDFQSLYNLTPNVTQSVAHHSYFGQEFSDKYGLPTLLLPAYTDLSEFPGSDFRTKEKLIIYSPDEEASHRQECLDILKKELPEFELVEIRDIPFEEYMDLATRCMFSISFGEGFDGYVAQPIYQGGLGMTVFNKEFFPDEGYAKFPVFFESEGEMLQNLVPTIRRLMNDPVEFREVNRELLSRYEELYSFEEYVQQIRKLALKEFEIFPGATAQLKKSA